MRRALRFAVGVCALAMGLRAGMIDVSLQSTQILKNGDSLEFLISSSSFANYAAAMGLSPDPASVNFTFMSMPVSATGQFVAELESPSESAYQLFPVAIGWTNGYAQNAGYSGAVSALVDTLPVSNALSPGIFAGGEAELVLTYAGPDINIGMPGRTLRQDLAVSFIDGPLSMGGMVYGVTLDDGLPGAFAVQSNSITATAAEPDSALLMLISGAGMCLLAGTLKRFRPQLR